MKSEILPFCGGCFGIILFYLLFYVPIVLWTDSNLDFYVSLAKHTPTDVPLWISAVISLFEPVVLLDIIGSLVRIVL